MSIRKLGLPEAGEGLKESKSIARESFNSKSALGNREARGGGLVSVAEPTERLGMGQ